MASGACAATAATTPPSFNDDGCSTGSPCLCARRLTADGWILRPRPAGRSGWGSTNAISCPARIKASSATAANSGVPANTIFIGALSSVDYEPRAPRQLPRTKCALFRGPAMVSSRISRQVHRPLGRRAHRAAGARVCALHRLAQLLVQFGDDALPLEPRQIVDKHLA